MSLAAWYSSQYSSWNRTRRLQQPQFLARTDTNTSRAAAAMAQNDPAGASADSPAQNSSRNKKASDPLFGPNIGPCSAGPTWTTTASRKKLITDDLTPEVLANWVEKSKQSSQPTTTLQALVNLKRPSLRLSPLSSVPEDSQGPLDPSHQHLHGLEFEYDCDAPKCGMYVHVVLSKSHPEAASVPSATNQAQILVFESVTSGGFGKRLTLDESAVLELGRYDHVPETAAAAHEHEDPAKAEVALETPAVSSDTTPSNRHSRRRFSHFPFRRRTTSRSVSGPALAVVDNDPSNTGAETKKEKEKDDIEGVRVIIRLAALDEQGTELMSPNEQTTFLHIVRLGAKAAESAGENADADDSKPWIVKVVKREATIGPHTFQLHEIYGLTSSTNTGANDVHTYPPQASGAEEEDPSSECLLCLSSPREVVLIPCRHLVACKECALNMVEFGAGGNLTHATEPAVPIPATIADGGSATTPGTGPSEPAAPIIPATTARRKRKAKGWFCPVCRQPYTSLLRISTGVPPPEKQESNTAVDGTHNHASPVNDATGGDAAGHQDNTEQRSGGILGGAFTRPAFLRSLARSSSTPAADVENQAGMTRVGA